MMISTRVQNLIRKTVIWLLGLSAIVYIVSGFGITEFRTVETLTFGLLTKNLAFKIHNALIIPSIILLALHLYLTFTSRRKDVPK